MIRATSFWTGVLLLAILAILTVLPAIVHAEEGDWVYYDFCNCWVWYQE